MSMMVAIQMVIAAHIDAVYQHLARVGQVATPSKRTQSSQSQVSGERKLFASGYVVVVYLMNCTGCYYRCRYHGNTGDILSTQDYQ